MVGDVPYGIFQWDEGLALHGNTHPAHYFKDWIWRITNASEDLKYPKICLLNPHGFSEDLLGSSLCSLITAAVTHLMIYTMSHNSKLDYMAWVPGNTSWPCSDTPSLLGPVSTAPLCCRHKKAVRGITSTTFGQSHCNVFCWSVSHPRSWGIHGHQPGVQVKHHETMKTVWESSHRILPSPAINRCSLNQDE